MLNASRRHRLGHLGWPPQVLLRPGGAQRLSASQTWSRSSRGRGGTRDRSAQRLSASQTWSRDEWRRADPAVRVLNASRRHRLGHSDRLALDALEAACSTPLGVTDLVTLCTCADDLLRWRAQRLSASQTWSPGPGHARRQVVDVLNASRRHRLGHARPTMCCSRTETVLNASRRHRLGHAEGRVENFGSALCAQRLSASQTWSLVSRPLGQLRRRVLNASRRHRLGHDLPDPELPGSERCSTPLGVTDLVTPRVANCKTPCPAACSTPLGVTDLVTLMMARSGERWPSCSTPLGVTDLVTGDRAGQLVALDGCSTPLGVTDLVTMPATAGSVHIP